MRYGWIGLVILLTSFGAYPTTAEDPYAKVNASWERFGAVYSGLWTIITPTSIRKKSWARR